MSLYLDDGDVRLYAGDAEAVLAQLPESSVHCVATSPPFFGLRDYGTGRWEGGDAACDHVEKVQYEQVEERPRGYDGGFRNTGQPVEVRYRSQCARCGAVRVDEQIGLEDTPDAWARSIVAVMREARRVLRDDGSLWIECGDSYASDVPYYAPDSMNDRAAASRAKETRPQASGEVKPTDLIGAPWLLAFALRADGWYLRGAYIWEKPDCMPESVPSRCTTSHSYVFHFSKTSERPSYWTHRDGRGTRRKPKPDYLWIHRSTGEERADAPTGREWKRINLWKGTSYFFDRDAIREPFSDYSSGGDGGGFGARADDERVWSGGSRGTAGYRRNGHADDHEQPTLDGEVPEPERRGPDGRRALHLEGGSNSHQHRDGSRWPSPSGRSPRSVWRIVTEASSFGLCRVCRAYWPVDAPAQHCGERVIAHFAVWPHELVGKIISAATSEGGCCSTCGAPRARWINAETRPNWEGGEGQKHAAGDYYRPNPGGGVGTDRRERVDLGWQPTCECDAPSEPCVVLDPFAGSATTARQARVLGRRAILIELNPDYAEIAAHRLSQQTLALIP